MARPDQEKCRLGSKLDSQEAQQRVNGILTE